MFAVIHVADFPLQARLRLETAPSEAPAALLDPTGKPPFLLMATASAYASGVAPGFTAPQALARCPLLKLLTPSPAAEKEAAANLETAASSLSPWAEATAPGIFTLRTEGVESELLETRLAHALDLLQQWGLHATGGIGPTPLLALYAARQGSRVFIVHDPRAFLAHLPLAAADPSPELRTILEGWGVKTLGELTALPKAAIAGRLGADGLALWERAAGECTRPLRLIATPTRFTADMECDFEMETLEPVLFILRRFVDRLVVALQAAGLSAGELHLDLTLTDDSTRPQVLRLPEPTTAADILFRTLHTYVETLRTDSPVKGIRLEIIPTRSLTRQHSLFDRTLRDSHRFSETLARVAALVGSDRVGTPVRENTHRPDAFRLVTPPACLSPVPAETCHPPQGLVLRRYRPPVPVTVTLRESLIPRIVHTGFRDHEVQGVHGPWYTSGGWWENGATWQREEWDVALPALHRLVRTPEGWWLEGEYD